MEANSEYGVFHETRALVPALLPPSRYYAALPVQGMMVFNKWFHGIYPAPHTS